MKGLRDAMEGARAAKKVLERLGWEYDAMSFCGFATLEQIEEAERVNHVNEAQRRAFWAFLGQTLR